MTARSDIIQHQELAGMEEEISRVLQTPAEVRAPLR